MAEARSADNFFTDYPSISKHNLSIQSFAKQFCYQAAVFKQFYLQRNTALKVFPLIKCFLNSENVSIKTFCEAKLQNAKL